MTFLRLNREEAMPVVIGAAQNGFTNPIGLLSDCHRRIDRFLKTLEAVADHGGVLDAPCRKALQTALEYFRSAAPRHTADEEEDLFPCFASESARN